MNNKAEDERLEEKNNANDDTGREIKAGANTEDEVGEGEKTPDQIIEEYKQKTAEYEDRYLRLAADFENYKKRTARQFEDILKNSNENIIVSILEVIDNFERALAAAEEVTDFKALHSGTELIHQSMLELLKKEGVMPIEAIGEPFDPTYHEAMMQVDSEEHPEGVVVDEMVKGYMLNGKVIRYAKVIVSRGKPVDGADEETEN